MQPSVPCSQDLVEEEAGGEPLALEPPLHVGEGQDDCVDLTARDEGAQLLDARAGVCGLPREYASFGQPESHKVLPKNHCLGRGHGDDGADTRSTDGPSDRLTPVLRPVRAGNGFEEALEQILQVVRLGLVPGGERLPAERELAERLGISRVTLREVLKVLQDQGLVESAARPVRRHVRAARAPTAAGEDELRRRSAEVDVEDVLRFREVLEVGAAGLCAAHGLTDEQRGPAA